MNRCSPSCQGGTAAYFGKPRRRRDWAHGLVEDLPKNWEGGKDPFCVDRQIYFSYTQNVPRILIITENRGAKEERAGGYAARCSLWKVFDNRSEKLGRKL